MGAYWGIICYPDYNFEAATYSLERIGRVNMSVFLNNEDRFGADGIWTL